MTAINRGLRSKWKRKELDSRITHTHTTHNSNDDDKFNNLERLTADDCGCNEALEASEKIDRGDSKAAQKMWVSKYPDKRLINLKR